MLVVTPSLLGAGKRAIRPVPEDMLHGRSTEFVVQKAVLQP